MSILILGDTASDLRGTLHLTPARGGISVHLLATLTKPLTDREVIRLYLLCGSDRPPRKIALIPTDGTEAVLEGVFHVPETYDGAAVVRRNTDTDAEHIMASTFLSTPYPLDIFFQIPPDESPAVPDPEPTPEPETTDSQPEASDTKPEETDPLPEPAPEPHIQAADDPAERARTMLSQLQENEAYRAFLHQSDESESPIRRALDTLEAIRQLRRTQSDRPGIADWYFAALSEQLHNCPPAALHPAEDYRWYRVESPQPPVNLSALRHLLSSPQVLFSIGKYGCYLLGLHRSERRIAVALPADANGRSPFANADDCCVYLQSGGTLYAAVCIELADDGQYFTPLIGIKNPDSGYPKDNLSGEEQAI